MPTARTVGALFAFAFFLVPALVQAAPTLASYTISATTIYPLATSTYATSTAIDIDFSEKVKASIKILDATGKSVNSLYSSSGVTNPDPKVWSGLNDSGVLVPFGVYTILISATSTATSTLTLSDSSRTITVAAVPAAPAETSFSVPLSAGWNLVSLPLAIDDDSIANVLGDASSSIDSVWSYDPAGGWSLYAPAHPELSTLATLDSGAGYWIKAHASTAIVQQGTASTTSRAVSSGWNLLGYSAPPDLSDSEAEDALESLGLEGFDYFGPYGFDSSTQQFTDLSSFGSRVEAGNGFWVFLSNGAVYVPAP